MNAMKGKIQKMLIKKLFLQINMPIIQFLLVHGYVVFLKN